MITTRYSDIIFTLAKSSVVTDNRHCMDILTPSKGVIDIPVGIKPFARAYVCKTNPFSYKMVKKDPFLQSRTGLCHGVKNIRSTRPCQAMSLTHRSLNKFFKINFDGNILHNFAGHRTCCS